MLARLAGGTHAVVATGTVGGRREATVIHMFGWQPGCWCVATVTRSLRGPMVGCLASRGTAVVTGVASSVVYSRMVELCPTETFCRVTGITTRHCWDVLRGFDNVISSKSHAAGVATGAIAWCALKNPADMTRFTACRRMNPRQRKA